MFGLIKEKAPLELKPAIPARQIPTKPHFLKVTIVIFDFDNWSFVFEVAEKFVLLWKTVIYKTAAHFVAVFLYL